MNLSAAGYSGSRTEWIWQNPLNNSCRDSQLLFRKTFQLDSIPSEAILQIVSHPTYHLYVNGMHVSFGPTAPCSGVHYTDMRDITQYLDLGINLIAVEIRSSVAPVLWHNQALTPAFWCQLELDGTVILGTNRSWKVMQIPSLLDFPPFRHVGLGRVQTADLSRRPFNWNTRGYSDINWAQAEALPDELQNELRCQMAKEDDFLRDETEELAPFLAGTCTPTMEHTFFSYSHIEDFHGGCCSAETFLYREEDENAEVIFSSDDPYIVYCNDKEVFRCSNSLSTLPETITEETFKIGSDILHSAVLSLRRGWNRILVIQQASGRSMGMFLLFPGVVPGSYRFYRSGNAEDALPGWNLRHNMRMPFSLASASLFCGQEWAQGYLPLPEQINDVSTYIHSFSFTPLVGPIPSFLREGEYAVYDLGKLCYGYPVLELEGSNGDIVDITTGSHFAENRVRSLGPYGRKTNSLRLAEGKNQWMPQEMHGLRYIMINVRKGNTAVIPKLTFCASKQENTIDLDFHSSDGVCNAIWKECTHALEQCIKGSFVDNPNARRCQSIPESYLYSRAIYTLTGSCTLPGKALFEFAGAQLENGLIPSIVPAGACVHAPDSSLLWILYAQAHWEASGDLEEVRKIFPVLENLLAYFRICGGEELLLTRENAGKTEFLNEAGEMEENGALTALNALYCRALLCSEKLCTAIGEHSYAAVHRNQAEQLIGKLREKAFLPDECLFADTVEAPAGSNGMRIASLETNIIALYAGIPEEKDQKGILQQILERLAEDPGAMANSHLLLFLLDILAAFNRQKEALALLQACYKINQNTDLFPTYCNTFIFPVAAGIFLIREVLGIRAAAPGMRQIYFNPVCRSVKSARGILPGISGHLNVEWEQNEKKELSVRLNSNFPLEVIPMLENSRVTDSVFHLGAHVNLLQ